MEKETDIHIISGTITNGRNSNGQSSPIYGWKDLFVAMAVAISQKLTPEEKNNIIAPLVEEKITAERFKPDNKTKKKLDEIYTKILLDIGYNPSDNIDDYLEALSKEMGINFFTEENPIDSANYMVERDHTMMVERATESFQKANSALFLIGSTSAHFVTPIHTFDLIKQGFIFDENMEQKDFMGYLLSHTTFQDNPILIGQSLAYSIGKTNEKGVNISDDLNNSFSVISNNILMKKSDTFTHNFITNSKTKVKFQRYIVDLVEKHRNGDDKLQNVPYPICKGTSREDIITIISTFLKLDEEELPPVIISEVISDRKDFPEFLEKIKELKEKGTTFVYTGMKGYSLSDYHFPDFSNALLVDDEELLDPEVLQRYHNMAYRKNPKLYLGTTNNPDFDLSGSYGVQIPRKGELMPDMREVFLTVRQIRDEEAYSMIREAGGEVLEASTNITVALAMNGYFGTKNKQIEIDDKTKNLSTQTDIAVFGYVPSQFAYSFFNHSPSILARENVIASYEQDYIPQNHREITTSDNILTPLHGNDIYPRIVEYMNIVYYKEPLLNMSGINFKLNNYDQPIVERDERYWAFSAKEYVRYKHLKRASEVQKDGTKVINTESFQTNLIINFIGRNKEKTVKFLGSSYETPSPVIDLKERIETGNFIDKFNDLIDSDEKFAELIFDFVSSLNIIRNQGLMVIEDQRMMNLLSYDTIRGERSDLNESEFLFDISVKSATYCAGEFEDLIKEHLKEIGNKDLNPADVKLFVFHTTLERFENIRRTGLASILEKLNDVAPGFGHGI